MQIVTVTAEKREGMETKWHKIINNCASFTLNAWRMKQEKIAAKRSLPLFMLIFLLSGRNSKFKFYC